MVGRFGEVHRSSSKLMLAGANHGSPGAYDILTVTVAVARRASVLLAFTMSFDGQPNSISKPQIRRSPCHFHLSYFCQPTKAIRACMGRPLDLATVRLLVEADRTTLQSKDGDGWVPIHPQLRIPRATLRPLTDCSMPRVPWDARHQRRYDDIKIAVENAPKSALLRCSHRSTDNDRAWNSRVA
jgi:hypothetical protein